jgi:hypothetical protein
MKMAVNKNECNGSFAPDRECLLQQVLARRLYLLSILNDDICNPFFPDKVMKATGTDEQEKITEIYRDKVGSR